VSYIWILQWSQEKIKIKKTKKEGQGSICISGYKMLKNTISPNEISPLTPHCTGVILIFWMIITVGHSGFLRGGPTKLSSI